MSQMESFRQHADARRGVLGQSLYGKQQLMLLSVESMLHCCRFAESQKFPDLITKLGESAVVPGIHALSTSFLNAYETSAMVSPYNPWVIAATHHGIFSSMYAFPLING